MKLSDRPAVSRVVSLFLLSQIFLIHHNKALICAIVELLINSEDSVVAIATGRDVGTQEDNITDEEKELRRTSESNAVRMSPHLESIMESLNPDENDYEALFALSLFYAMGKNKGTRSIYWLKILCINNIYQSTIYISKYIWMKHCFPLQERAKTRRFGMLSNGSLP